MTGDSASSKGLDETHRDTEGEHLPFDERAVCGGSSAAGADIQTVDRVVIFNGDVFDHLMIL